MRSSANILGAALGLHAFAFALLALLHAPARPRKLPIQVVTAPSVLVAPENRAPPAATPAPRPPPARPARSATVAHRRRRPHVAIAATAGTRAAPVAAPRPEPPPAPVAPAPGSDAAVLLATIGHAARNDAALEGGPGHGDGAGGAARGSAFLRGGVRGAATPPHESRAQPARPVEDYTRLVPPYSDAAIDHDVNGMVSLRVETDSSGRVVRAEVLKGLGYGLDEIAVKTIMKYRFHPALDDEGRPKRAVFGWRMVWESHWKRLFVQTLAGHPTCRGSGPLNLDEYHPEYIDCDGPPGYFELSAEDR